MTENSDNKSKFEVDRARFGLKPQEDKPHSSSIRQKGAIAAAIGYLLLKFKSFGALLFPLFKILKLAKFAAVGGKILATSGTMLISIWFYAQQWGWKFAVGFVLSIFVHELGHVFAAWRLGIPVSAPIFIPGFGALILQKRAAKSTWDEAIIGIGGPAAGLLAGLFCIGLYHLTGSHLYLALAYTGFFINLFNLIPVPPLDGGWIVGAVSPYLWLIGTGLMVIGFLFGYIHNPMILMLVVLSLPRLWRGLKTGSAAGSGVTEVTMTQRLTMGTCYIGLATTLAVLMSYSLH